MPVTLGPRGWGRETASLREAWAQDETLPQKKLILIRVLDRQKSCKDITKNHRIVFIQVSENIILLYLCYVFCETYN